MTCVPIFFSLPSSVLPWYPMPCSSGACFCLSATNTCNLFSFSVLLQHSRTATSAGFCTFMLGIVLQVFAPLFTNPSSPRFIISRLQPVSCSPKMWMSIGVLFLPRSLLHCLRKEYQTSLLRVVEEERGFTGPRGSKDSFLSTLCTDGWSMTSWATSY